MKYESKRNFHFYQAETKIQLQQVVEAVEEQQVVICLLLFGFSQFFSENLQKEDQIFPSPSPEELDIFIPGKKIEKNLIREI